MATRTSSYADTKSMDWQLNHSLSECATHLYMNEHMSDVTFVLTSVDPPKRVPAHRFLLAIRSPVFEAMFYGLLQEVEKEVTLPDAPVDGFLTFLRFLYTDVAGIHADNAMECLQVGHMYQVPGFVEKCENILNRSINAANVLYILETAIIFKLQILSAQCMEYIKINTPSVIKAESFLSLSKDALTIIVGECGLQASELEIYTAVNRWARNKCEREGVPASHDEKRKFLGDTFSLLRLGQIPVTHFASVVARENLLTKDEIVMVFRLHHDETVSKLTFVENEKRDGTAVCSIPSTLSAQSRLIQTQFREVCFKFNRGVNFVGINVTEGAATIQQTSGCDQFFSVLLLEENPGNQSGSSQNNDAFLEKSTLFRLERDKSLGPTSSNFDVLFDSPFFLKPEKKYALCITSVYCSLQSYQPDAGVRSCKVFDPTKVVQTDGSQKYNRHACGSNTSQSQQPQRQCNSCGYYPQSVQQHQQFSIQAVLTVDSVAFVTRLFTTYQQ